MTRVVSIGVAMGACLAIFVGCAGDEEAGPTLPAVAASSPSSPISPISPGSLGSNGRPAWLVDADQMEGVTQPPLEKDPMSYTQKDLFSRGYPPRPDPQKDPNGYNRWMEIVSTPVKRVNPTHIHMNGIHGSSSTNNIWSGVELDGNLQYASAFGTWTMPTQNTYSGRQTSISYPTDTSIWIGLDGGLSPFGGGQSPDVVQMGTDMVGLAAGQIPQYPLWCQWKCPPWNPHCVVCTPYFYNYAWVEWYPDTYDGLGVYIAAGDLIYSQVWIGDAEENENTAGGYAWFWMWDYTRGYSLTTSLTPPTDHGVYGFTGNTAEYIIERPGVACIFCSGYEIDPLANFGTRKTIQGINSRDSLGWGHDMGTDPFTSYNMVSDSTGHLLSLATAVPPSTIYFSWQNYY